MRNGQNKRMRGRNRKGQNPLTRIYESNGPDVKIRGTASHVAEKYVQLARDAQASGDPVAAENYFQHAEHYFRLIAAAQEQFRQNQPYYRPEGDQREDGFEDTDEEAAAQPVVTEGNFAGRDPSYGPRETQSQGGREAGNFGPREQPYQGRAQLHPQPQPQGFQDQPSDVDRLPAFITGASQPQPPYQGFGHGSNGFDGAPDRFPLHRRRRRRHGPRGDGSGMQPGSGDPPDEAASPQSGPIVND
jgi:hypothetical protein